jgi:hypothetical protein
MRVDLQRLGTVLLVLVTIVTLLSLSVYGSLKEAVTDVYTQAAILRGDDTRAPRTALGQWLSAPLASDIAPGDAFALNARADETDHRADRLLEVTAVVALVGVVLALMVGPGAAEVARARDHSTPLANTSSNGTV